MFSFLILYSLLAVLLTEISGVLHIGTIRLNRGECFVCCIPRLFAENGRFAICRTGRLRAAVPKAGAPPGWLSVTLVQVPRKFQHSRRRPAAAVA